MISWLGHIEVVPECVSPRGRDRARGCADSVHAYRFEATGVLPLVASQDRSVDRRRQGAKDGWLE